MEWNLTEAKMRLSEVLNLADTEAQIITRRNRDYVVLTGDDYRKLKGQEPTLTEFLIDVGPRFEGTMPMERSNVPMRDPQL